MDYTALLAAVAAYTKRSDTAAMVPTWISLAEVKLARELRHYRGLTRTTITADAEFQDAPDDLIAIRSARLTDSPFWPLQQLTTEQLDERRATRVSGTVDSIALVGAELGFSPPPAAPGYDVELSYYAALPALTVAAPTNWVLANFPDLYLWGVLAEASNYYEDDESLMKYGPMFRDALIGVNMASVKSEAGFNLSPSPSMMAI